MATFTAICRNCDIWRGAPTLYVAIATYSGFVTYSVVTPSLWASCTTRSWYPEGVTQWGLSGSLPRRLVVHPKNGSGKKIESVRTANSALAVF